MQVGHTLPMPATPNLHRTSSPASHPPTPSRPPDQSPYGLHRPSLHSLALPVGPPARVDAAVNRGSLLGEGFTISTNLKPGNGSCNEPVPLNLDPMHLDPCTCM